jgi:hypothetical protein
MFRENRDMPTGYRIAYRSGETNHCPACGRTHWLVGRIVAECAHCSTAVPLNDGGMMGTGLMHRHGPHHLHPLAA